MRQTIKFWLRCVRFAASGNVPYANDWQWVFANPLWQSVGAAVGGAIGSKLSAIWPGAPVIGTDTWAGVLLGGVAGFVITWLLFFAVRFVHAPSALFHAEMARANDAIVRFDALVSAKDDASRDTKIGDAIGYICYRRWGKDYGDAARSGQATGTSEYVEFLQAAADGHIPVWGKKSKSGVYEPVPASFWFKNQIEWFGLVKGDARTEPTDTANHDLPYFSLMTSRAAVGRYWPPEIGGSSARALPALKITFGMDGSFVSVRGSSMSQLKRALSFRIENRGPAGISQGSVVIESANCAPELSFPIVLKDNIALAAGADIFVPLVKYGEPRYPGEATGDSFAQLLLSDPVALFDINEQAVLKLKATGFDTPPYKAQCRIWVSNGRLQIQNEWRHD